MLAESGHKDLFSLEITVHSSSLCALADILKGSFPAESPSLGLAFSAQFIPPQTCRGLPTVGHRYSPQGGKAGHLSLLLLGTHILQACC